MSPLEKNNSRKWARKKIHEFRRKHEPLPIQTPLLNNLNSSRDMMSHQSPPFIGFTPKLVGTAHRQNQIIPHGWQDAMNGKAKPRNHFSSIITACSFLLCRTYTAEVSYWSSHQGDWLLWSSISRPSNKNSYFTRIRLKDQCRTLTIGISDRPSKMVFNPQDSNQREWESSESGKAAGWNGGLTFILDTRLAWQDGSRYYQSYKR